MSSATAARARTVSVAVPTWVWIVGLVVCSAVLRYALGRRLIAPWIMIDELVYSELAKSLAETGSFFIRDEPAGGAYGIVYPALIAPAFALFDSIPDAYAAAKAINAVVVSLAVVPAYFLARRVLDPGLSLVAAGLSVALPSLLYAGTLMTENAFYPLFLTAALTLLLAVERPTPARVAIFVGVAAVAFATRAQAVVLIPALLSAPLLMAAFGRHSLRVYRWLYALPAAAGVAVVLVQLVRGSSLLALLGAYRVTGEETYDGGEVARWLLYHVAELDLSLGVLPFAALLLLVLIGRRLGSREQAFLAVAVSLSAWLLLQVAAFASRHSLRVEERNMFYLAPLFLVALLLWIQLGLPRPRLQTALAAGAAAVLPAFLPYRTLIDVSAVSDTFGLLPWWTVHEWGVPLDRLWLVVFGVCAAVAAAFALVPQPYALALPALLLAFFLVTSQPVEERIRTASIGSLFQGITRPERDWVDRAVGPGADVAAIWSGRLDQLTVLENEFFSRSVGRVYTVDGPLPAGLTQTPLRASSRDGLLAGAGPATHALVDDSVPVAGRVVARDERKGLRLIALDGPLRLTHTLAGTYDDGWSGPSATYTRYACTGGTVAVDLESDPNLFSTSQTVVARAGGAEVARGEIPREGTATLLVPLRADAGRCTVSFTVTPTAVPGGGDPRRLGTHFRAFRYRSSPKALALPTPRDPGRG